MVTIDVITTRNLYGRYTNLMTKSICNYRKKMKYESLQYHFGELFNLCLMKSSRREKKYDITSRA